MRSKILIIATLLAGCQGQPSSVYDRPIPDRNDKDAMFEIRDGVKPEDQDAWQQIVMRRMNPMAKAIMSKTVGEAIGRVKAKAACMEKHDVQKAPANDIAAYNKEVHAYNECLKMPV